MKTLNRFAMIVRPANPFIEWAAKAIDEPLSKARHELEAMEPGVYLTPESDAVDLAGPNVLKGHWPTIFKEELDGWCTDETRWPEQRSEAFS